MPSCWSCPLRCVTAAELLLEVGKYQRVVGCAARTWEVHFTMKHDGIATNVAPPPLFCAV